jgi:hypothetical protein
MKENFIFTEFFYTTCFFLCLYTPAMEDGKYILYVYKKKDNDGNFSLNQ